MLLKKKTESSTWLDPRYIPYKLPPEALQYTNINTQRKKRKSVADMRSTTTFITALLASAAVAQPRQHGHHRRHQHAKRELVVEWETVWETATVYVDETTTETVLPEKTPEPEPTSAPEPKPEEAKPSEEAPVVPPGQFFETPSQPQTTLATSTTAPPPPPPPLPLPLLLPPSGRQSTYSAWCVVVERYLRRSAGQSLEVEVEVEVTMLVSFVLL